MTNHQNDLQKIIDFIKKNTSIQRPFNDDWIWWKNSQCKYINITIDMRDGEFVLRDRDNKCITLDELKKQ